MSLLASFKGFVADQLARRGYALIPRWRLDDYPVEQYLRRLFAACEIDCVFDVGANAGQYYKFIRHVVGFDGPIVCFEPLPEMQGLLHGLAETDKLLYVEDCALGAEPGRAPFNVMQSSDFSSFLNSGGQPVREIAAKNTLRETIDVRVRTLTEVYREHAIRLGSKRLYLKLDTQGFDLEILKGGLEVLPLIPALQSEMTVTPIYEGIPDYRTSIGVLDSYGYRLSAIYPTNPRFFPRFLDFDAFMIRGEEMDRLSPS